MKMITMKKKKITMNNMEVIYSLGTGAVMGAVFSLLKLPVPAPQVFAGVAGIIGIWLGYTLVVSFIGN